ncbi:Uncharacterised protein [Salmonella enterica subsp. enterica serovar Bovismorbificans]|nr:Uncharacterised protein [Salmonella enterica subsp. enterica serovar Bovismorbificans]
MGCRCRAVGFTEGMPASDQRHGLFVVHPHIAKGSANGGGGRKWFAAVIRPFRVNVDKAHLGRAQRRFCQRFRVSVSQPGFFIAPVHIQIRFPDIFTPGAETEGTEAGVFQRHVTRQNKQVGPGNFLAIFLLNRPQQTTRLIQADVIRPGVKRRKTLLTTTRAATTINRTVGASAMPGHTNKQTDIAAPVGGPPRL